MPLHAQDSEPSAPSADLVVHDGAAAVAIRWRPFGEFADLDVDFEGQRGRVVTDLLARCRHDVDRDLAARRSDAQRMTIAARIGGLAAIVARASSAEDITISLQCPLGDCRETLQVSLSLETLRAFSQDAERDPWVEVSLPDAPPLRVRRPTGDDQQRWHAAVYATAEDADAAMVATLLATPATPALSRSTVEAIDAALEDADPLVCFRLTTDCPACGRTAAHAVDLEGLLLARLQRLQGRLFRDVHRLARHYGWSEQDIAAVPAWRRRAYLDLLDQEAS